MSLPDLIAELRAEIAAELPLKLHQSSGESVSDDKGRPVRRMTNGHPATWTGLPFSQSFDRFLNSHGGDYLASDSFKAIRDHCRVNHWREQHGSDPFAWNLCARIAIAAVELRQPVAFIADAEGLDGWLTHNLLLQALEYARKWRLDRRAGVIIGDESRRQLDEAEAIPVLLAREHSITEEERIWELWRQKFPYLRSWDSELTRRRAWHATHCVERCPLLMSEAA